MVLLNKYCILLILIMLLTLTYTEARAFTYEYKTIPKYLVNQNDLEEKTLRAYNFITKYIPDPVDRNKHPIHVEFTNLKNYLGFVHHTSNENQTIKVHDSMKSAVEYQLVIIHELTHILRNAYQPNEERWIQEGLANLIQTLFAGQWPKDFENDFKNLEYFHLSNSIEDYQIGGSGYLVSYFFTLYLYEHFGKNLFIKDVATGKNIGAKNIEEAISNYQNRNSSNINSNYLTFNSLWTHFSFAALLNEPYLAKYNLFFLNSDYSPVWTRLIENKSSQPCRAIKYCFSFKRKGLTIQSYVSLSDYIKSYEYDLESKKISETQ